MYGSSATFVEEVCHPGASLKAGRGAVLLRRDEVLARGAARATHAGAMSAMRAFHGFVTVVR